MAFFSKKKEEKEETKPEETSASSNAPSEAAVSLTKVPTILVQPRISEKASRLAGSNKYVFNVLKSTNKIEVKKAVENAYKVKVTQVNIINVKGKQRNFGRISGKTSAFKKAIVSLREGDKIEGLTENI